MAVASVSAASRSHAMAVPARPNRSRSRARQARAACSRSPPAAQAGSPRYYRLTAAGKRACAAEARRLASFVEAARDKRLLKKI